MIHLLTALAVKNGRTLKQTDCKFVFIQATLPSEELTVAKPPIGCSFLKPRHLEILKNQLYGLCCAPCHWYNMIHQVLEPPEIGLKPSPHNPCIIHGTLISGKPPIYIAIHANNIIYFSMDDNVEQYFPTALSQKIKVKFLGDAEWYIGIKFD